MGEIDDKLRNTLYKNDIINVNITNCATGKRVTEDWSFIYDNNNECIACECIDIRSSELKLYRRIKESNDDLQFVCSLRGQIEKITLFPYEAQLTGEIRHSLDIGDSQYWKLICFIRG